MSLHNLSPRRTAARARLKVRRRRGTVTEATAWRRRRRGARRWWWCAAVAQRRSSARWQRRHDSGAVMEAPIGPLRAAWARRWPPVEATRRARRRRARARATDSGQRGGASTAVRPAAAASRRSTDHTEEVDRALAAEIKTWKESDARRCSRSGRPPSSRARRARRCFVNFFIGVA